MLSPSDGEIFPPAMDFNTFSLLSAMSVTV